MNKPIDYEVFNGIRKTINRFREQPFFYFTESDIHASLSKDIMEGNSDLFILRKDISRSSVPISLVHHEYPTNFRYLNDKLKTRNGYVKNEIYLTNIIHSPKHGKRGHFDLTILNKKFINNLFEKHQEDVLEAMKHIINKDIDSAIQRRKQNPIIQEIIFSIEVKFIHPFNSGNNNMESEVIKDNHKLNLALKNSDNFIKPINLVFCNSNYVQSNKNSIIENIKNYLIHNTHEGVCSIFIESYYSNNKKTTIKPIVTFSPISKDKNWADELINML